MIPIVILSAFFIVALCYYIYPKRKYNHPPGPRNIFPKGLQSPFTYQLMAKHYGHIFRTKFGFWNAIILDDPNLIRQAFSNTKISDRIDHKVLGVFSCGSHDSITHGNGRTWHEQRRFALRTLRDFGFGKQTVETFIMQEVHEFLGWMKENQGVPTAMDRRFVLATVNSLFTMIAGERQDQDNTILDEIMEKSNRIIMESLKAGSFLMGFPQAIDILPHILLPQWTSIQEKVTPFMKIFHDAIDFHKAHPTDPSQPRDFIDSYLTEIKNTQDPESTFYGELGHRNLQITVTDLFGAGQSTTSVTLTWAVLYLTRFPQVQVKLQKELDEVVGPNRLPRLSDRPKLPYTNSLMSEVLRYSSIVPLGVFHEVTEDTTLGGYDIEKGTVIIPNLYAVHYSKEIWEDPENFRPERFLSDEGKTNKGDNLMAFSVGKRQCLGESLARDTFFLFLTNIFHQFKIIADPSKPLPTLDCIDSILREPYRFEVIMTERKL